MQVTYIGNITQKHGLDYGNTPTGTVVLHPGEQITSIFGRNWWWLSSIGFTTSWEAIYGPWGDLEGGWDAYSLDGPVYGLFGGFTGSVISGLGIWTTDNSLPPSPTPAPNPPGMMRTKMFGGSSPSESQWDDGPNFAGKHNSWQHVDPALTVVGRLG
jgi:hypothetical protein